MTPLVERPSESQSPERLEHNRRRAHPGSSSTTFLKRRFQVNLMSHIRFAPASFRNTSKDAVAIAIKIFLTILRPV
jgi:hypothetical protein